MRRLASLLLIACVVSSYAHGPTSEAPNALVPLLELRNPAREEEARPYRAERGRSVASARLGIRAVTPKPGGTTSGTA
jgi:hypothetical protein